MATECWSHCAWTGCGGKPFPPLRCWASCWILELQGPSPCGLWSAWGLDWKSLSSASRKERQVSPAAQCSFWAVAAMQIPGLNPRNSDWGTSRWAQQSAFITSKPGVPPLAPPPSWCSHFCVISTSVWVGPVTWFSDNRIWHRWLGYVIQDPIWLEDLL